MAQMLWEYLLVYCTSHFLRSLGEPPAPGHLSRGQLSHIAKSTPEPLPVWIIFLFSLLVSLRYIVGFFVNYIFEVISTVVVVSSVPVSTYAAASARAHSSIKQPPTNKKTAIHSTTKHSNINRQDSLLCCKAARVRTAKRAVQSWSTSFLNLPCFRGLNAYLIMHVSQWYLSAIVDFLLSGQPEGLQLGYGSSSVLVTICFGGGLALWTHCAITERSSDYVYNHFPKGHEILPKLVPVTAMWAFSRHIALSLPLAVSRYLELRHFVAEPDSWSNLDALGQVRTVSCFLAVYALHLSLVACASIPATMVLRRVHATMLDAEEVALVPHHHAQKEISITEAWSTMSWKDYRRVVAIYIQHYFLDHLIHLVYWSSVWALHRLCQTEQYDMQSLPNVPRMIQVHIFDNNTPFTLASKQNSLRQNTWIRHLGSLGLAFKYEL
ncbi:MAG: hypothetical protein Q9218_006147 [Villophora microphyllina]